VRNKNERVQLEMQIMKYQRFLVNIPDEQFQRSAKEKIAELKQNPDLLRPRELLLLRNTRPINVWGLPAISIPCGFTPAGLPIGLQIIGPHWGEAKVLQLAHAYEQATAWHKREPMH